MLAAATMLSQQLRKTSDTHLWTHSHTKMVLIGMCYSFIYYLGMMKIIVPNLHSIHSLLYFIFFSITQSVTHYTFNVIWLLWHCSSFNACLHHFHHPNGFHLKERHGTVFDWVSAKRVREIISTEISFDGQDNRVGAGQGANYCTS